MTEVAQTGGNNPRNFVIDPKTGEEKYIFDKEGRDLLKSLVEKFIELQIKKLMMKIKKVVVMIRLLA